MKSPASTPAPAPALPPYESPAWSRVQGKWQPLHGSFEEHGLSVEWHDFRVDHAFDWSRTFHPNSLEICLNFSGQAELGEGGEAQTLAPNQMAIYTSNGRRIAATRSADTLHRFLTLELSPEFLQRQLGGASERLKPAVRRFMAGDAAALCIDVLPLPSTLLASRVQFVEPGIPAAARSTWYLGRILEVLALTLFDDEPAEELFCQRHLRQNRIRIDRARYLIERDLENPPSLEMLATELGCSPFYLSRVFAQETGASIPKFLRMKRIEKAAELIRTGKVNVTEAAMTVGYSSLSAFNKAFVEQIGCCPGLYPHVPISGRKPRK